ncbi:MAG: hypothetical protein WDO73_06970 [Ignavibacteriota bacterium]
MTLAAVAAAIAAPAFGETGSRKLVDITKTQSAPFQPGGTIRVDHTYGELSVEGWDRPEVELTFTKSPDGLYGAKEQDEAGKLAENVSVTFDRKSDSEIDISTAVAHFRRWTHPFGPKGRVALEYRLRVPRNSKLAIHHENGEVMVSGVVGDIDATGNAGDIVLLLPETEKYSIDAKNGFGTVWCDIEGDHRHGLAKSEYTVAGPAGAHKISVRMGRGGIEIKGSPAAAQPVASGASTPGTEAQSR